MKKISYRYYRAALLCILLLAGSAALPLSAQTSMPVPNSCCTFSVVVSNTVPSVCLPVSITTSWGGVVQTNIRTVTGIPPTVYSINACPPVPPTLDWVSLDGGITRITVFNALSDPFFLPCGTCVQTVVIYDGDCIFIRISIC